MTDYIEEKLNNSRMKNQSANWILICYCKDNVLNSKTYLKIFEDLSKIKFFMLIALNNNNSLILLLNLEYDTNKRYNYMKEYFSTKYKDVFSNVLVYSRYNYIKNGVLKINFSISRSYDAIVYLASFQEKEDMYIFGPIFSGIASASYKRVEDPYSQSFLSNIKGLDICKGNQILPKSDWDKEWTIIVNGTIGYKKVSDFFPNAVKEDKKVLFLKELKKNKKIDEENLLFVTTQLNNVFNKFEDPEKILVFCSFIFAIFKISLFGNRKLIWKETTGNLIDVCLESSSIIDLLKNIGFVFITGEKLIGKKKIDKKNLKKDEVKFVEKQIFFYSLNKNGINVLPKRNTKIETYRRNVNRLVENFKARNLIYKDEPSQSWKQILTEIIFSDFK